MIIDLSQIVNISKDLLIVTGAPMIRSLTGWAAISLQDNRITKLEWRKLAQTVIKVGTMGLMGYFGLSIIGVDNAALAAAIGAFFADKILNALKQTVPIRR